MGDLRTTVVGAMSNPLFTWALTDKPLRQDQRAVFLDLNDGSAFALRMPTGSLKAFQRALRKIGLEI